MRLNKPIITISLIIILVVNLVFFSLLSISQSFNNKVFLHSIIDKFNLYNYILNDKQIKDSIDHYKYKIEVFDYIDNNEVIKLKNSIVDDILKNHDILVDTKNIKKILKGSVSKYEQVNMIDTLGIVDDDIDNLIVHLGSFFDSDFINAFSLYRFLSNKIFYLISIIISLIVAVSIIVLEKKNGYLISGLIFLIYSFILYYLNYNFFNNSFFVSFDNRFFDDMSNNTLMIDNSYMICFILGFVLLLIYIVKLIKKLTRDIRLYSYESNWR